MSLDFYLETSYRKRVQQKRKGRNSQESKRKITKCGISNAKEKDNFKMEAVFTCKNTAAKLRILRLAKSPLNWESSGHAPPLKVPGADIRF